MDRDLFDFGEFTNINSKSFSPEENQGSNFGGYGGPSDTNYTTAQESYNTYSQYASSNNYADFNGRIAEENEAGKSILTQGIVALCLAMPPVVGIAGIIVGAICCGKKKSFENKFGPVYGKAKVGSILGLAAVITGIALTLLYVLYFLFMFWLTGLI